MIDYGDFDRNLRKEPAYPYSFSLSRNSNVKFELKVHINERRTSVRTELRFQSGKSEIKWGKYRLEVGQFEDNNDEGI